MASGRMEFHAQSIMQHAGFSFVLPNDVEMEEVRDASHYERPTKTLILLHGLTGTDTDWLYGGVAQQLAIQYNLAVFMPTTGNSFYLDRGYPGGNYATFVGEELPEYIHQVFGVAIDRDNLMIAGLSMGGYGAIHTALAYPDRFGACAGLSSALHLDEIQDNAPGSRDLMQEKFLQEVFGIPAGGSLDNLLESEINPEYQIRQLQACGTTLPKIYMAIGTEDSLYESNQRFRQFLESSGAAFKYEDGPGKHDWFFWNEFICRACEWMLK